jgi:phosphate starvation-inducible PhoH-like protein
LSKKNRSQVLGENFYVVSAKNEEQKNYIKSIINNQITIVVGPPGSGKSLIATMMAMNYFFNKKDESRISSVVFTRPCVEANGERLGYLPGSFQEKLSPYLLPIMNILEEKMYRAYIESLIKDGSIRTIPFAFLRGLSFHKTFILADEVQNATSQQIRLLLTRMGEGSKMVLTGDINQSDIGPNNGLADAVKRFKGIDGIGIIELTNNSIFRSKIVADIEDKYKG